MIMKGDFHYHMDLPMTDKQRDKFGKWLKMRFKTIRIKGTRKSRILEI